MIQKYIYSSSKDKRKSIIVDKKGEVYTELTVKPRGGATANTRFFGRGNQKVFVVKCPKCYDRYGPFREERVKKINEGLKGAYQKEQKKWNTIYPNNPAYLFTENGLRLVLPFLPGEQLRFALSKDQLVLCQQLLSFAKVIDKLHTEFNLEYADFNLDNVLIEQKPDGTFNTYPIDCGAILPRKEGLYCNQEIEFLKAYIPDRCKNETYDSIKDIIGILENKIKIFKRERPKIERKFILFNSLSEKKRDELVKEFSEKGWLHKYSSLYEEYGFDHFEVRKLLVLFLEKKYPNIFDEISKQSAESKLHGESGFTL